VNNSSINQSIKILIRGLDEIKKNSNNPKKLDRIDPTPYPKKWNRFPKRYTTKHHISQTNHVQN